LKLQINCREVGREPMKQCGHYFFLLKG